MSKSVSRDTEKLLNRLPEEIAKAIREGESDSIEYSDDDGKFSSEELPYPYNLEGAEQIDS